MIKDIGKDCFIESKSGKLYTVPSDEVESLGNNYDDNKWTVQQLIAKI